jgi:hypothetical protein
MEIQTGAFKTRLWVFHREDSPTEPLNSSVGEQTTTLISHNNDVAFGK